MDLLDDDSSYACWFCGRFVEFESDLSACDGCHEEGCARCVHIEDDAVGAECPGCRYAATGR